MKVLILFLSLVLLAKFSLSQNITLSDDENYEAHSSAMVDIYSKTKGLLVPRVTNTEMNSIATPANGLIVYNSSFNNYYYWDGSEWKIVAVSEYFQSNGDTVFITGDGKRFGIGTRSPMGRLTVMGDSTATSDEPLFEVKNSQGEIIFAVYENEVQVNFKESSSKALKGGFAVGGLTSGKSEPTEYLRITPDSVRIYIDDSSTKAQKGGFAVGGLTSGKANQNKYFLLNQDSTRIYHKTGLKAQKGGFAVGGLTGGKSVPENYLTVERDSTRIYVNENGKAQKGGFAVGGLTGGKGSSQFLDLTVENYLIGHRAGDSITSGTKNFYAGYEAGMGNKDGFYNVAIGYQAGRLNNSASNVFIGTYAGKNNVDGWSNVFIGNRSGFNNQGLSGGGYRNVFIGREAGYENSEGLDNIYIGAFAGSGNEGGSSNVIIGTTSGSYGTTGSRNVYLGKRAGYANDGSNNVFLGENAGGNGGSYATVSTISNSVLIGNQSGYNNITGQKNVFIGYRAGYNETGSNKLIIGNNSTSRLIYGDFSAETITLNGNVGINTDNPAYNLDINDANATISLNGYRIARLTGGTGIDNDIVPYGGSSQAYDLGNNTSTEHWDDVVALEYVTYTKSQQLKSAERINIDFNLLEELEPVHYKSDESEGGHLKYGLTIESLLKVAPAAVVTTDTDFDPDRNEYVTTKTENPGINYDAMIPVVVSLMQQQQKTIQQQAEEIKTNSKEIEELKKANKELRDLIESLK